MWNGPLEYGQAMPTKIRAVFGPSSDFEPGPCL